ncbi:hypothetical protein H072_3442 [Dactylellina haptotyla CBS 200.50]|uniref:Yeast cell wall synthesis Kre9/Knh1-like N-terminal domain-containing protein n=1 Tax=Dactylellina haptotyla (strain CBS 200.50) TaxID=1284197 RepID=S8C4G0_DACHA|nr:hypothetical protein H072_3442 [Dactylellina haptotyla CBS 200.50]
MQLQVSQFVTLVLSASSVLAANAPPAILNANAITAPLAGDLITAGETYTIKWTNVEGSIITLNLVDGPANQVKPVTQIVTGAPNNGVFTWTVPDDLPTSTTYAIRISYNNNPKDWNYSDRFTFENQNVIASAAVSSAASSQSAAETSSAAAASVSASTEAMSASASATEAVSSAPELATQSATESATESIMESATTVESAATETETAVATKSASTSSTKATRSAVPTNPAPVDGENNFGTKLTGSGSLAGLVVAIAGLLAGGAFVVV